MPLRSLSIVVAFTAAALGVPLLRAQNPQSSRSTAASTHSLSPAQTSLQSAGVGLDDTSWQLVKFEGSDDKTLTPDDKTKYTIAFASDGRVSVRIDCNRGHGTWKSSGPSELEFGPLALTRAMCPPAPLNDRIPKDWQYVRSYILKDGHLFVALMADGGIYEFEPMSTAGQASGVLKGAPLTASTSANQPATTVPAEPLENTSWKLIRLGETPVNVASQQREPYLVLDSENRRVSGSGGCNRLTGSYQLNGDRLTFSQMASTMMACMEGMGTEKAFLDALTHVQTWKISRQQLELFDPAGSMVARFEARHIK